MYLLPGYETLFVTTNSGGAIGKKLVDICNDILSGVTVYINVMNESNEIESISDFNIRMVSINNPVIYQVIYTLKHTSILDRKSKIIEILNPFDGGISDNIFTDMFTGEYQSCSVDSVVIYPHRLDNITAIEIDVGPNNRLLIHNLAL